MLVEPAARVAEGVMVPVIVPAAAPAPPPREALGEVECVGALAVRAGEGVPKGVVEAEGEGERVEAEECEVAGEEEMDAVGAPEREVEGEGVGGARVGETVAVPAAPLPPAPPAPPPGVRVLLGQEDTEGMGDWEGETLGETGSGVLVGARGVSVGSRGVALAVAVKFFTVGVEASMGVRVGVRVPAVPGEAEVLRVGAAGVKLMVEVRVTRRSVGVGDLVTLGAREPEGEGEMEGLLLPTPDAL